MAKFLQFVEFMINLFNNSVVDIKFEPLQKYDPKRSTKENVWNFIKQMNYIMEMSFKENSVVCFIYIIH